MSSVDFGVVVLTQHPPDRDPTTCVEEIRQQAALVDQLEYDTLWVGEHHFTDDIYFDNFQILSYLAAETHDVSIGTSVCLVSLHNPVQLAERVANLDVLAAGRLIFGGGVGYRQEEFDILGVDRSRRGSRTQEALELMPRLWAEDAVSFAGTEFTFDDVSINPKPVQSGGPDIWIGGSAPPAVRRAATHGDAWMIDPRTPLEEVADTMTHYNDALLEQPVARPIWREVFVAPTDEAAIETARPYLVDKYEKYLAWGGGDTMGAASIDFDEFASDRFLIGAPETVASSLDRYEEQLGVDHFLLRMQWPGMPVEDANDAIELFADEVITAL